LKIPQRGFSPAEFEKRTERAQAIMHRHGFDALLLTTPPNFPPAGVGDFIEYVKLLGHLRGLTRKEIVGLVKIFTQSAADFLDEWFESEQLKVTLATAGVIGANGGPRSPGRPPLVARRVATVIHRSIR